MRLMLLTCLVLGASPALGQDWNFSSGYGQLRCQDSYRSGNSFSNNTDPTLEFYGEVDTLNDEATVGFKYVIPLGKERSPNWTPPNRCNWAVRDSQKASRNDRALQALEIERMRLENRRLRLQVESMERNEEDVPIEPTEPDGTTTLQPWPED